MIGVVNVPPDAVSFDGCGFWDAAGATGTWFTSAVGFSITGWSFHGCLFESSQAGPIFSLKSLNGLSITGCRFDSPGGGTPNIFDPSYTITNGSWQGNATISPVVDNHTSVFV